MIRQSLGAFLLALACTGCAQSPAATMAMPVSPAANVDIAAANAPGGPEEAVERIVMIRDLIHYGTKDANALALITAARMTRGLPVYESRMPVRLVPNQGQKVAVSQIYSDSVDGMLKRARRLSGNDRLLATLIREVEAMPKPAPGGAAYVYGIANGSTDEYELTYPAGKRAVIYIESQDEDLYVRLNVSDEAGHHVCTGDRRLAESHCIWTPKRAGKFRFSVENASGKPLNYLLFTN